MSKIVVIGSPPPSGSTIARIIADKNLDIEFISESEANKRFADKVDKMPPVFSKLQIEKLKSVELPLKNHKSKFHK